MAIFLSVLLGHFIKHKPLFYEEWDGKRRKIFTCMIWKKKTFLNGVRVKKTKTAFSKFLLCKCYCTYYLVGIFGIGDFRIFSEGITSMLYYVCNAVTLFHCWNMSVLVIEIFLQIFLSKYFIHDAMHVCALKMGKNLWTKDLIPFSFFPRFFSES